MTVTFDNIAEMMNKQIEAGIAAINAGNEVLLADESGTSVRDIDKILKAEAAKETSELPKAIQDFWNKAEKARAAYKASVDAARNAYRTEVLGEEAKTESDDVDKDVLKEQRSVVMNAITFLRSYAQQSGQADLLAYVDGIQVPQIGRQGSSSVGLKKPRVFVTIGDTQYESFTKAALALSTKETKVTAGELATVWNDAGGNEGEFKFGDHVLSVQYKTPAAA